MLLVGFAMHFNPRWLAAGFVAATCLVGSEGHACSLAAPSTVADSLPTDGATDVPLDVQPVLVGDIQSVDVMTTDGSFVEFAVEQHSQGVIIEFAEELEPKMEYVIDVVGRWEEQQISFTTGTSTSAAVDVPVVSGLAVEGLVTQQPGYWVFLCDSPHEYLCLGADVPEDHVLVVETETSHDDIGSLLITPEVRATYTGMLYGNIGNPAGLMSSGWDESSCVTVHLRDIAGRRGQETTVCEGDFPVHRPKTLTDITCDGGTLRFNEHDTDARTSPPSEEPRSPDEPAPAGPSPDSTSVPADPPDADETADETRSPLRGVDESQQVKGCSVTHRRGGSSAWGLALMLALPLLWRRRVS